MEELRNPDSGLVVFADDGAPAADAAWAWVSSHPWVGWRLNVLTVHETLFAGGPPFGDAQHVLRHAPAEAGFVQVEHLDREGDPRIVLTEATDASLLVVGCHHRGHLAGLWAGSTTEWLLVRPPRPLVVARHGHRSRSVAICVDGSGHARYALDSFLTLPWSADAQVSLVSVDDGRTDPAETLAAARGALPAAVQATEVHLSGSPTREIPTLVRAREVDLVVLGTRGLTGLSRMTTGSTVAALMKDGTANLLVAHRATS